jgi:hypothetical protein
LAFSQKTNVINNFLQKKFAADTDSNLRFQIGVVLPGVGVRHLGADEPEAEHSEDVHVGISGAQDFRRLQLKQRDGK